MINIPLWGVINSREPKPRGDIPESLEASRRQAMDESLRLAIYHLLWVWKQYGRVSQYSEGEGLDHANTTAGEDASTFLEYFGLGFDQGYGFITNEVAIALMDCEVLPPTPGSSCKLVNYGGRGEWNSAILGPIPPKFPL